MNVAIPSPSAEPSRAWSLTLAFAVPLVAVATALAASAVIIGLSGASALEAYRALLAGSFGSAEAIARTFLTALPVALAAFGWIIASAAGRANIGLEGQMLMGGTLATAIGIFAAGIGAPLHLILAVATAIAAGALWAGVAAWLWTKRQVNEMISTLMLNFIALAIVDWAVNGPLQEPTRQFPNSAPLAASSLWPHVLGSRILTLDILLVPFLAILSWVFLYRTRFGLATRLTGANPMAARQGGHATVRLAVIALVASGALAGVAGSSLILGGGVGKMAAGFSANYGFTGIVVALLARGNVWAVLPSALLMAALIVGGGLMESRVGVSAQLVLVTQGLVILLVAGSAAVRLGGDVSFPPLSRRSRTKSTGV